MIELISTSIEETMAIGAEVAKLAKPGDVIALCGELGAGKTQFTRGLAVQMGIHPSRVSSPTFVIAHEYEIEGDDDQSGTTPLIHIDAYRLETLDDLETIGWDRSYPEMREQSVVAIEWADRIDEHLGENCLFVRLSHGGEGVRYIALECKGDWYPREKDLQAALLPAALQACTNCGKPVSADATTAPFCSKRCRMVDLGRWVDGSYTISRSIEQSDLEQLD